jgi:hypothetical protein
VHDVEVEERAMTLLLERNGDELARECDPDEAAPERDAERSRSPGVQCRDRAHEPPCQPIPMARAFRRWRLSRFDTISKRRPTLNVHGMRW